MGRNWLDEVSGIKFEGSTLIAVCKNKSAVHEIAGQTFLGRSGEKIYFSVHLSGFEYINFNPQNWDLEVIGNKVFFLKRIQADPTHRGAWPRPDSDLYIIVNKEE